MSRKAKLSKGYANFLTRFNNKYKETYVKDKITTTIIVPEKKGIHFDRVGKYKTEEMYKTTDAFGSDFRVYLLESSKVPAHDPHKEDMKYNQEHASIAKKADGEYRITFDDLKSFASSVEAQGTHKWLAIAIETGEDSVVGMKFNGYTLTADDAAESRSVGLTNGDIIYWMKADRGSTTAILTNGDKETYLSFII